MTKAVCPGSFDPVTAGHLDVIERSTHFFDEVHVVVAVNAAKTPMFSAQDRVDIIRRALKERGCENVIVSFTDGLITDYCRQVGASVIVKGLRQNGDYEAELGMALGEPSDRRHRNAVPTRESRAGAYFKLHRQGCRPSRRRRDGHGARLRDTDVGRGATEGKDLP